MGATENGSTSRIWKGGVKWLKSFVPHPKIIKRDSNILSNIKEKLCL
jgi:hypothetical protein